MKNLIDFSTGTSANVCPGSHRSTISKQHQQRRIMFDFSKENTRHLGFSFFFLHAAGVLLIPIILFFFRAPLIFFPSSFSFLFWKSGNLVGHFLDTYFFLTTILCCRRKNDDDKHSITNTLRHACNREVAEDDAAGSLEMLMGYSTINCKPSGVTKWIGSAADALGNYYWCNV